MMFVFIKSIKGCFQRGSFNNIHVNLSLLHLVVGPEKKKKHTGPRSAVGNVSGYRCVSDCRSRGREFDPGSVPYFRGD